MKLPALYVHQSILEWFENEIQKLHPINDIIVEEIFHNQFDKNINHLVSDRYTDDQMFDQIWMNSKFKMPWISNRTYFLQVENDYEIMFTKVKSELDNYELSQHIVHSYRMNVAWMTIEEIEIFDFSPILNIDQLEQIDNIFFKCISSSKRIEKVMSLYLAEPLPWHNVFDDFIDIDRLALDLCAGEWKQNNLLNDFSVEELLSIELANKDFRVPYYNDYLDRYVQNLLSIKVNFTMENDEKIEYSLPSFDDSDLAVYFMFKFHRKFSTLYTSEPSYKINFNYISKLLKIRFDFAEDKFLVLAQKEPDPNVLVTRYKYLETMIYQIHNYNYFTCELFNELLSLPNKCQVYDFDLSDGFNFIVPLFNSALPVCSSEIKIILADCSSEHEQKLSLFIRYLIKLFKGHCNSASLSVDNCYIANFSIFENFKESFSKLEFAYMDLNHAELLTLAPYLSNKNYLALISCKNITDTDVLSVLQNSEIHEENLSIEGLHGCTPLVYFILAEFLMRRKKTSTIYLNEMPKIKEVDYLFKGEQIGFHEANGILCLINLKTNEQIDFFQLMYNIDVDDAPPFEYT